MADDERVTEDSLSVTDIYLHLSQLYQLCSLYIIVITVRQRSENNKILYTDRIKLDAALEQRFHLGQFLGLPADIHLMVGDEPLVGEYTGQVFEYHFDAERVHRGRKRRRHVDVRVVGQRLFLRERRDHRHVVAARRQGLHQALVHYPVAAAVNGEHAEDVGAVGGGQRT